MQPTTHSVVAPTGLHSATNSTAKHLTLLVQPTIDIVAAPTVLVLACLPLLIGSSASHGTLLQLRWTKLGSWFVHGTLRSTMLGEAWPRVLAGVPIQCILISDCVLHTIG